MGSYEPHKQQVRGVGELQENSIDSAKKQPTAAASTNGSALKKNMSPRLGLKKNESAVLYESSRNLGISSDHGQDNINALDKKKDGQASNSGIHMQILAASGEMRMTNKKNGVTDSGTFVPKQSSFKKSVLPKNS